ncbi:FAD-dependent oxidoreductase [Azorhizobium oxalatiphilum]|uniref:FAD-dependent oxidoreductase n=1 Tax=Azorhizobium oxalatiphilum TaxID=980631 RepID=A0A917C321_9HYPH|nr:FAD-binding oxidoreductase [Azorhizobium oxalatiphilum]GGF69547.1 FAD-dependent oxidoreductase [Azorhizobium oxalatiphilum]
MARTDAIVLGAGIVGVSAALHLKARGLSVALVDRQAPGEGTSFGNAGSIEVSALLPVSLPRDPLTLLRHALKLAPQSNYRLAALPSYFRWLLAYFAASTPERQQAIGRDLRPLMAAARAEHHALAKSAGAMGLLSATGWLKVYRNEADLAATATERAMADELGVAYTLLNEAGVRKLEPALKPGLAGGVHWTDSDNVSDPGGLVKAYAALFEQQGGLMLKGDARSLRQSGGRWRVETAEGPVDAEVAVVALGPWSLDLLKPLNIPAPLPMAVKRGYHVHFEPKPGLTLSRGIVDRTGGFALQWTRGGIRATTGIEFARREDPRTDIQVRRVIANVRKLVPLEEVKQAEPWLGFRPAFADSKPVIGPAPGLPGLFLDFGHSHWGLTLGPASGRLIADMVTGATPFVDPAPYAPTRFAA